MSCAGRWWQIQGALRLADAQGHHPLCSESRGYFVYDITDPQSLIPTYPVRLIWLRHSNLFRVTWGALWLGIYTQVTPLLVRYANRGIALVLNKIRIPVYRWEWLTCPQVQHKSMGEIGLGPVGWAVETKQEILTLSNTNVCFFKIIVTINMSGTVNWPCCSRRKHFINWELESVLYNLLQAWAYIW